MPGSQEMGWSLLIIWEGWLLFGSSPGQKRNNNNNKIRLRDLFHSYLVLARLLNWWTKGR